MIHLNSEHSNVSDFASLNTDEKPYFSTYTPDIAAIKRAAEKYRYFENIILIGNGGSNTSFRAVYNSLPHDRNMIVLTTIEESVLTQLSSKYNKHNTLILAISKSGQTVNVIEAVLYFLNKNYDVIAVTSDNNNTLHEIVRKKGLDIIPHPDIGGRFSANTSSALFPLALAGIDIEKLSNALLSKYQQYNQNKNNIAFKFAQLLFDLEQKHYTEIFMPVYSQRLSSFLPLITQLMHETFCKQGKGLTFFGSSAPESQHHTNQRIFGGRKNLVLVFLKLAKQEKNHEKIAVPDDIKGIKLKTSSLAMLDNIPYDDALDFEFQGTYSHAVKQKIPSIVITLNRIDEENIASLIAFWQYSAVYSAWLRNLNPFDQPEVEYSKNISFELRKNYKRE